MYRKGEEKSKGRKIKGGGGETRRYKKVGWRRRTVEEE
jgi:hypothetical protein